MLGDPLQGSDQESDPGRFRQHGWAGFVSMQDHYNLLDREEEREMLPSRAHEGVGTIPWSPLARGRLAREAATARSGDDPFAEMLYTDEESDMAIIEAVAAVAQARGSAEPRSLSPGCTRTPSWSLQSWGRANRPISTMPSLRWSFA